MSVLAVIGPKAIYFLYAWLIGCMLASTAAGLKGYAERWGLATGMFLSFLGGVIWLFVPARAESRWDRVVRPTDLVTIAGGVLLGAACFLPWYETAPGNTESLLSGQFPLGVVALAAAALAITHVLLAASEAGPAWILERSRAMVAALGLAALVVTVYRVAVPPGDHDLEMWAYLAPLGAILTIVGPALGRFAAFPRASQMEHGPLPA